MKENVKNDLYIYVERVFALSISFFVESGCLPFCEATALNNHDSPSSRSDNSEMIIFRLANV